MNSEKIYCGRGKKGQWSIKLNICLDKIPTEWVNEYNGQRYVRLELRELRQADEKGNTHSVQVDTWRPDGAKKTSSAPTPVNDDVPF